MNTNVQNAGTPAANGANVAKTPRKARKPMNAKRLAAETALKNAKSDQEKAVARSTAKAARFEDLARARVRKASKTLEGIEKLANRAAYSWTDEQMNKILGHLTDKLKGVINKFADGSKKEEFDL